MTMEQVLTACGSGKMPRVSHSKFGDGLIVAIKCEANTGKHSGCAVKFDCETYEKWFHDSDELDQRRAYLRDLHLNP